VNEAATFVRDIVFQNATSYSKVAASFTTFKKNLSFRMERSGMRNPSEYPEFLYTVLVGTYYSFSRQNVSINRCLAESKTANRKIPFFSNDHFDSAQ
jgi:hypothetical protein